MADNKDDGLVTSAPASAVGSLLTDLLNEAKQEVQKEREHLEKQVQAKEDQEKSVQQREEARKRDELQRKLIEETRKRNEALTRKERAEAKKRDDVKAKKEADKKAQAAANMAAAPVAAVKPPEPKSKLPIILALLVVLVGGGVGAYMFATQPEGMAPPELAGAVNNAIMAGKLDLANISLGEAGKETERLKAKAQAALKNAKTAGERAQAEADLRKAAEASAKAQAEARARMGAGATTKSKRPRKKKGGLKINTSVF